MKMILSFVLVLVGCGEGLPIDARPVSQQPPCVTETAATATAADLAESVDMTPALDMTPAAPDLEPAHCGLAGEACCPYTPTPGCNNFWLGCVAAACVPCGEIGEPCCPRSPMYAAFKCNGGNGCLPDNVCH